MTTPVSNSGEPFLYSSSPVVACLTEMSRLAVRPRDSQANVDQEGFGRRRARAASTRRSAFRQRTTFTWAFQDTELVVQHQQLGLISGAIAKACEGEVDEESEAGVKDEEEHGRRLIVVVRKAHRWFEWTFWHPTGLLQPGSERFRAPSLVHGAYADRACGP